MRAFFFSFIFVMFSIRVLFAVPAYPNPITFTQPNGDTLTVRIMGDERIHWHQSMDGYTLLFNNAGYLTYAQLDEEGNLQPSAYIATNIENRDAVIHSFLNTIEKNLFYSDSQQQLMLNVWQMEDDFSRLHELNRASHFKTICAFVQFPEKAMIKTMEDFEGLMNQLGYTGNGTGSVRDYFRESSYKQFDLTITFCGVYTAPFSESYYASGNTPKLASWLGQKVIAEPNIDLRDFDTNGDGLVDGFHIVFAGRGQEAGGGEGTIWSHMSVTNPYVVSNGKTIGYYSCSPELYVDNITTIGVICHEMSHAMLNVPDFYDTDGGVNGSYDGTGSWDIMASGSWNGAPGGNRPPHHNMYSKAVLGWVKPILLDKPATIKDMPNSAENPVAYRINTTTNNEYFLLENRQKLKFDTDVPGNGLIIYRVHSNVGGIQYNNINSTHPQRMYPVCASSTVAIPNADPKSYGNINSAGCPFPGTSEQDSFTDETTPSMKSWSNKNTGKPITDIKHANKKISFEFFGGACATVNNLTVEYQDDCSNALINWDLAKKRDSRSLLWNNPEGDGKNGHYSVRWEGASTNRIVMADDFDIPEEETWAIDEISFYGYPATGSKQPEHIGVAFYHDNGNNRPLNPPFYENISLIPVEGFISGKMTVILPIPIVIEEAGKYWISIYGMYDGAETASKLYNVGISSVPKTEKLCRWDPLNFLQTGIFKNWNPTDNAAFPSMAFSLAGFKPTDEGVFYNVYRDDVRIAGAIKETHFLDINFNISTPHTWSVAVICIQAGEGDRMEILKNACNVGIGDIYSDNLIVYSYSNSIIIQNDANYPIQSVEIFDMMGRLIYQSPITETNTEIMLQVPDGIYGVKLVSHDKITTRKVLLRK